MSEVFRKECCIHEAAHTVVALHFGYRIKRLVAWGKHHSKNGHMNVTHYQGPDDKEHLAIIAAAGLTVTEIENGGGFDADNLMKYIHGKDYKKDISAEELQNTITQYVTKAKNILELYKGLHDEIADALLDQSMLGEGEIRELQHQFGHKLSVQEKMVLEAQVR